MRFWRTEALAGNGRPAHGDPSPRAVDICLVPAHCCSQKVPYPQQPQQRWAMEGCESLEDASLQLEDWLGRIQDPAR